MTAPKVDAADGRRRVAVEEAAESEQINTVHILVYTIDTQTYGLFLADVERTVRAVAVSPVVDVPDTILGIINARGRVIPVVNMRKKLQLAEREIALTDQFVIARTPRRTVALVVDSVEGVIERAESEVIAAEEIMPETGSLQGVVRLPDGLVLIQELGRFLFDEEEEGLDDALSDT